MEVLVERCCGIDVHKKSLTGCIIISEGNRIKKKEIRTYGTMTEDIEQLREWLKEEGVSHVAIESTGVYWKPVFNILEGGFEVVLANARHIKNVPGRKTDVRDSEWLCMLLRAGLIRGSFIPWKEVRELRDLTRYRSKLKENIASEKNRVQKYLEDANIKLSSVATDIFGASGREMLKELIKGEVEEDRLSALARGKLKRKEEELKKAFRGRVTEHHRMLVRMSLEHIEYMEREVEALNEEIERLDEESGHTEAVELLDTIPGVDRVAAEAIIGEIGTDMSRFASAMHLASWAGVSPGNNESAGKKKAGRRVTGISG